MALKVIEVRVGIDETVQGISSTTLGLSGTEASLRQVAETVEDGWVLDKVQASYDDIMRVTSFRFRFKKE